MPQVDPHTRRPIVTPEAVAALRVAFPKTWRIIPDDDNLMAALTRMESAGVEGRVTRRDEWVARVWAAGFDYWPTRQTKVVALPWPLVVKLAVKAVATERSDFSASDSGLEQLSETMDRLGIVTHGVETITADQAADGGTIPGFNQFDTVLTYVNRGDTYATTFVFNHLMNELRISSWGAELEAIGGQVAPAEPTEPQEGDWVTSGDGVFREAGDPRGRVLLRISPDAPDRVLWSAIDRVMEKQGVFPDVWVVSDHGNAHRMVRPDDTILRRRDH